MTKKIFISYSHQDGTTAHGIARFLARHGHDVWIDSKNLTLGDEWSGDIETALAEADHVVAIISAASVRRGEVLKEIGIALDRARRDENFSLLFVVIGKIHNSWFKDAESSRAIVEHLNRYQYIELSAYGEVTIETMKKLLNAIDGKAEEISSDGIMVEDDDDDYINGNALPEKAEDSINGSLYYRVFTADLSPSCLYPFALDNQWLPEIFADKESRYHEEFAKDGFKSQLIRDYLYDYQRQNFYLSLIHSKQIIISRNTILFSPYFQRLLLEKDSAEREAFMKLLSNGSIAILLYGNGEISPFIHDGYRYSASRDIIDAWNQICTEVPVYCLRENWAVPVDQHSIEILRFATNLAMDRRYNELLGRSMHIEEERMDDFLATLKNISMQSFCQTHMNGTENYRLVDGYSRSSFYRNYIVKNSYGQDTVQNCIYDENKPFHSELKRLMDIYYNSMFANHFKCEVMLPSDSSARNLYLNMMYLSSADKEVSIEEVRYAFAEFFESDSLTGQLKKLGTMMRTDDWDLSRIIGLRNKEEWIEYVELLDIIKTRSNYWKVDFNEIELLTKRFVSCFDDISSAKEKAEESCSFRIAVGYNVLDVIDNGGNISVRSYDTVFDNDQIVPLVIQFGIGDISDDDHGKTIFTPITLFNGRIDTADSEGFYYQLKEFLEDISEYRQQG